MSKKKLFGRSSEQAEQMVMEQLSFTYNEAEAYVFSTKAAAEKPVAVKAHERKRQSGNVLDVVPEGILSRFMRKIICRLRLNKVSRQ